MTLRFPNARLHILNLLADEVSGAEAILLTAAEFGLVNRDWQSIAKEAHDDGCLCLGAAKSVLQKYFDDRENSGQVAVDVAEVWKNLLADYLKYEEASGKKNGADADCCKTAPIIFDLMLQQIRRYP